MSEAWRGVEAALDDAIRARVTPGASLCAAVRRRGEWRYVSLARGALAWDEPGDAREDTLYDLASLTKPFTAWAAMRLRDRGALDLAAPISRYLPERRASPAAARTLDALLSHRAGLPAWRPLFEGADPLVAGATRERALDALWREVPGDQGDAVYSDLGYILAGEALAAACGRPLEEVLEESEVLGALRFRCDEPERCAPTERCPWRGRVLRGEVHDENCFALGGAAGHAGLFGDARSVCARGVAMVDALRNGEGWALDMLRPRPGGSHRLGWDTRSPVGSSAGARMGPRTFGHLGFTGTSLWCDPDAEAVVALLTNRVHPSREGAGIRALRPAVHDAVLQALTP